MRFGTRMNLLAVEPRADVTRYALASPGEEYFVLDTSNTAARDPQRPLS